MCSHNHPGERTLKNEYTNISFTKTKDFLDIKRICYKHDENKFAKEATINTRQI